MNVKTTLITDFFKPVISEGGLRKLLARCFWEIKIHSQEYHHITDKTFLEVLEKACGNEVFPEPIEEYDMKTESKITVYSINGEDCLPKDGMIKTIRIESGSRHNGAVNLVIEGKSYTVTGGELKKAIDNALNV